MAVRVYLGWPIKKWQINEENLMCARACMNMSACKCREIHLWKVMAVTSCEHEELAEMSGLCATKPRSKNVDQACHKRY